jgi:hypothetical protein
MTNPNEMKINGDDVIAKMQQLYPVQFAHSLAEVKVDTLAAQLAQYESQDE